MEQKNQPKKSFRSGLFNKRAIIIMALLVIVLGAGGTGIMLKVSDDPAFCNTCHIMKPYYNSWHDSNLLAHKHAAEDLECHDCHEPSLSTQIDEGIKFITGNYKNPLDKRQFSRDFCLECHDDFDSIKAATNFEESNPHDSHNGEQECNLCHSMHQPSQVMCSQCHLFSWPDELDDSWEELEY